MPRAAVPIPSLSLLLRCAPASLAAACVPSAHATIEPSLPPPRAAPAPKPLRPPMTPVTRAFNHFCSHALNYGVASEAQLAAMVEAVGACESEDQREAEQLRLLEEGLRGADVRSHTRT